MHLDWSPHSSKQGAGKTMLPLHSFLFSRVSGKVLHRCFCTSVASNKLLEYLKGRIKATGPVSIATYMKEALTNPRWGYYMTKDVFGTSGDFITSPEISQMFGEMVGIWFLTEWLHAKQPKNVRLVELGPGRGTLMADILRVFSQLKVFKESISIHLIEVSQEMRKMQKKSICGNADPSEIVIETSRVKDMEIEVSWHNTINEVPPGYTFYLAHEFFDALPVHLFKRTPKGWREVLVDADNSGLQFVLAPGGNPLSELFIPKDAAIEEYEVCPDAAIVIEEMAKRIAMNGGSSLIVDYGKDGPSGNSLRSFKNHNLVEDILQNPGTADITANVDFSLLKRMSSEKVQTYGPRTQAAFLKALGIETRCKVLLQNANAKQRENLISGIDLLLNESKMGNKFKVLAMNKHESITPAGF